MLVVFVGFYRVCHYFGCFLPVAAGPMHPGSGRSSTCNRFVSSSGNASAETLWTSACSDSTVTWLDQKCIEMHCIEMSHTVWIIMNLSTNTVIYLIIFDILYLIHFNNAFHINQIHLLDVAQTGAIGFAACPRLRFRSDPKAALTAAQIRTAHAMERPNSGPCGHFTACEHQLNNLNMPQT